MIGSILAAFGMLLCVGSFFGALWRMARFAKDSFSGSMSFDEQGEAFGNMFVRHIGAMIGMVIGMILFIAGLSLAGAGI